MDFLLIIIDKCQKLAYNQVVPRTEAQIIEEAAQVIQLRREMPDVSDLAAELGVSRQTLYNRVDAYLKEKADAPTTGKSALNIVTTEAA